MPITHKKQVVGEDIGGPNTILLSDWNANLSGSGGLDGLPLVRQTAHADGMEFSSSAATVRSALNVYSKAEIDSAVGTLQPKLATDEWLQWGGTNVIRWTTAQNLELNAVSVNPTFDITLNNARYLYARNTGGTAQALLGVDAGNAVTLNGAGLPIAANSRGVVRAYGYVTGTTGALASTSFGISSVTRNAAGDYTVNWSTARSAAPYPVTVSLYDASRTMYGSIVTIATTGIIVRTATMSTLAQADADFSVAMF